MGTTVRLKSSLFRGSLSLKRTPIYLRFTCSGIASCSRNWDALDQLDDQAEPGERLFAGKLAHKGSLHLDRVVNGRKVGEWYGSADYELIEPQPSQETMRDNALWRSWVESQLAADPPASPS